MKHPSQIWGAFFVLLMPFSASAFKCSPEKSREYCLAAMNNALKNPVAIAMQSVEENNGVGVWVAHETDDRGKFNFRKWAKTEVSADVETVNKSIDTAQRYLNSHSLQVPLGKLGVGFRYGVNLESGCVEASVAFLLSFGEGGTLEVIGPWYHKPNAVRYHRTSRENLVESCQS